MTFTNAERQARFRANRKKELEALRKLAAKVQRGKAAPKKKTSKHHRREQ